MMKVIAFAALLCAALTATTASARDWIQLNGKPLQDPFNPNVVRVVMHRFGTLPGDVAEELARKIIGERGRPGTLCKGEMLAGMSFGNSEVWNGPVRVVWANVREDCKPVTLWETQRGPAVYVALRVHACRNLGVYAPRQGKALPLPGAGPIYGRVPPCAAPTGNCC